MSYSLQSTTSLSSLADAIRSKTGGSSQMTVEEMITAVNSITSGGNIGSINIDNIAYLLDDGGNIELIDKLWDYITFNIGNFTDCSNGLQYRNVGNNAHNDWRTKTIHFENGTNNGALILTKLFLYSTIKYTPKFTVGANQSFQVQLLLHSY